VKEEKLARNSPHVLNCFCPQWKEKERKITLNDFPFNWKEVKKNNMSEPRKLIR